MQSYYYHNKKTGKTAWTREEVLEQLKFATGESIDAVIEKFDPITKRKYYYNKKTGKSAWTRTEVAFLPTASAEPSPLTTVNGRGDERFDNAEVPCLLFCFSSLLDILLSIRRIWRWPPNARS